jgi:hypothetical protein
MKQVIFIGGTAYSGSTSFDMTLANDSRGFSCGEVRFFFHPTEVHHVNPACSCNEPTCAVWPQLKKGGPTHVYLSIFELFPEVEFIVDSSKDPFWIQSQSAHLRQQGVQVHNILIWKDPLEIASSYKKRGQSNEWERSWMNYHRLYYSLVPGWRSVRYRDFAQNRETLQIVCNYLQIPYFEGKERYWEKQHHILFGNTSALVHLKTDEKVKEMAILNHPKANRKHSDQPTHRSIYYDPVEDSALQQAVHQKMACNPLLSEIGELLEHHDVRGSAPTTRRWSSIELSTSATQLRAVKRLLQIYLGKARFTSA